MRNIFKRKTLTAAGPSESRGAVAATAKSPKVSNIFLQKSHGFGTIQATFDPGVFTTASFALRFYATGSPVKIAVDRIADQLETFPLVVENLEGDQIKHPVLDLLAVPNVDSSLSEFLKALALYYSLTGNIFFQAVRVKL